MTRHAWIKDLVVRHSLSRVETTIEASISEDAQTAPVYRQLLARRSKRLRSAILLLSARFGTSWPQDDLVRTAASIELLHEATLYHDDIVDLASNRRGEPTAHVVAGVGAAARTGAVLMFASPALLSGVPPALRRAAGRTVTALCWGQLGELENLDNTSLSTRRRLRIMRDKTASLFAFAAMAGASLAGAPAATVKTMRGFGMHLGMCFQLADDLRDLLADEADLGREPGADLRDGVFSLPILHGLNATGPAAAQLLDALHEVREGGAVEPCLRAVRDAGGIRRGRATLDAWLAASRFTLSSIDPGNHAPALSSLDLLIDNLRASVPVDLSESNRSSKRRPLARERHGRL